MKKSFAPSVALACAREGDQGPRLVALHGEHRVDEQADIKAAFVELADYGNRRETACRR